MNNYERYKLYIDNGTTQGIFLRVINRKILKQLKTEKIDDGIYLSKLSIEGMRKFGLKNNIATIPRFLRLSHSFYLYVKKEVVQ